MKILAFILLSTIVVLTGCEDKAKSKQWYMEHQEEMEKAYNECKDKGDDSINCRNAKSAYFEIHQNKAPVADLN